MKTKTIFTCQNCGYQSPKWLGKCPDCNNWNTFVEENYAQVLPRANQQRAIFNQEEPVLLNEVRTEGAGRFKTGFAELDRVLGGGIVSGSVVLIGGDPGIGKSTIALQVAYRLAEQKLSVLYVSGEESVSQVKLRAERLTPDKTDGLYIVNQTDLSYIIEYIRKFKPQVVIIDSIQVMYEPSISSSPGSVSQVRECAGILTQLAKSSGIALFIIGHVTKEGAIAGPRVLEHIVDTVLYFEGDRFSVYRILRAVKNRFGSTNEIGVFEMGTQGLLEVTNPSQIFLSERPKNVPGSVVVSIIEGTRPLLVEIQALVSKSTFGYATRRTQGFDYNRLGLLVAVLDKRIGLHLESEDIFVNVVGGIKVEDPAADLAVAVAVASAFREIPIEESTVVLGEVGLAGEIRSVSQSEARINEAQKLGFSSCVLPAANLKGMGEQKSSIALTGVSSLREALDTLLQNK